MYRPKKGSPTIISVVSLSRMEVSLLLRLCYIHFQPVQAFLAPGLHFSEFSSLTEEKVPKRCLHTCLPSGFCQDTLVSSLLRYSFGPLRQSQKWSPCSRLCSFCGFLDSVSLCATRVWLNITPCFLLVLHMAALFSFLELVSFHHLRLILADVFVFHLEVSRSSVGRNGYPDRFYSVKSFVAASFLELLPRFHSLTLIVYGFSVPYYGL